MADLARYFHTDWAALTLHDWIGLIITVAVFFLMIGVYFHTFDPKRKSELEAQRNIPLHDEIFEMGERK